MFSCEFYKMFKNAYLDEHLRTVASAFFYYWKGYDTSISMGISMDNEQLNCAFKIVCI